MNRVVGQWLMLGCVSVLTACGAAPASSAHEDEASIQLNLTTTAASGAQYRLGPATFAIWSTSAEPTEAITIDASGAEPQVFVPLDPGLYWVSLEPGWSLSRLEGEAPTPVAATLTSQASQKIDVVPFRASPLTFAFHLGESGVDIGVSVEE